MKNWSVLDDLISIPQRQRLTLVVAIFNLWIYEKALSPAFEQIIIKKNNVIELWYMVVRPYLEVWREDSGK